MLILLERIGNERISLTDFIDFYINNCNWKKIQNRIYCNLNQVNRYPINFRQQVCTESLLLPTTERYNYQVKQIYGHYPDLKLK